MSALGGAAPFGGNLLPPGATGGTINFQPTGLPSGSQHVSVIGPGAHVSYDVIKGKVSGVHGTIHGQFGAPNLIVPLG